MMSARHPLSIVVPYDHLVHGGVLVPGWTSIISAITIFGTMQLLLFSVFGEYLGRICEQSRNGPPFIIRKIKRANPDAPLASMQN